MQRSLYSGVSGLTNHQLILDITANNLANVSTSGFKGSRISFATALTQTQSAGSSPGTNQGGLNPRQVGLGVKNSSVDVDFKQGALLSTGRTFDLAIQGNGFFHLKGADGSSAYTRVGNLNYDSKDNLVDVGSGMIVQGRALDSTGQPSGDVDNINISNLKQLDAKSTQTVTFQGNLSSSAGALQGQNLSTLLPMVDKTTGLAATETTELKNLDMFRGGDIPPTLAADQTRTIWAVGTKPDGTAFAGSFTLDPWSGTVQSLLDGVNSMFVQGSTTFASAKLENGSISVTSSGDQKGFSLFLGEKQPLQISAAATLDSTAVNYAGTGTIASYPGGTYATAYTVPANDDALVRPAVTLVGDLSAQASNSLSVKLVQIDSAGNTTEIASKTITGANFGAGTTYTFDSMPHVKAGDRIAVQISGTLALAGANTVQVRTFHAFDRTTSSTTTPHLTSDTWNAATGSVAAPGTIGDGIPDIFQENSQVDVNEWQYRQNPTPLENLTAGGNYETNNFFSWYRSRFVPEKVTSSVQIYDSLGGAHTVEARYFRTGTSSTTTGATVDRYNGWDMVINIPPSEGTLVDGLITGIKFDSKGRYVGNGNLGQTLRGNPLSDSNTYAGTPGDNTFRATWSSTGTQTVTFNLGDPSSTNGLTGFGSASTAAAVDQDGYAAGTLDTMSVSSNGNIVGLYTNGKSKSLYQVEVTTFRNPTGLTSAGNNLWGVSTNSGDPLSRAPGEGGAGSITSGALEGSNIDIASEFTRLITAQRGFQVNARVITTTDSVLQELSGLVR